MPGFIDNMGNRGNRDSGLSGNGFHGGKATGFHYNHYNIFALIIQQGIFFAQIFLSGLKPLPSEPSSRKGCGKDHLSEKAGKMGTIPLREAGMNGSPLVPKSHPGVSLQKKDL
jgi:hypothetical protein